MAKTLTLAQAEAIKNVAKTASDARGGRTAFAELVIETIQPNHLSLDLFSAFMPTVQKNKGDQIGKRIRRGRYPIRTMTPGAKHLTDVLSYQEYYTMMFDRLIAGTSHNVWEIQSGEVGTVEQFRTELKADLFDEIVSRVFTLLSTAWTSSATPSNFVDASATGVTQTVLDAMIETILNYSGEVRAIIGTRAALLPIYRFAQFKEFVLTGTGTDRWAGITDHFAEFQNTNKVSTYLGIPLIELPQVYRNRLDAGATSLAWRGTAQRMIPTDKVLVIGGQPGQIVLMDGFEYQDYTDPTTQPANYVLHGWQSYGLVLDDVLQLGIIKTNT
jgi:hypothetical protein